MILAETYMELMKNPSHWLFEITLMIVFDVILAGLLWPILKRAVARHDRTHH